VGVALPALEAMLDANGTALAQTGQSLPRRFGVWFFGGGVVKSSQFFPAQTGPLGALTEMLAPLERVKEYLTLVSGPRMSGTPNGGGHHFHRCYALSNTYKTTSAQGYPGVATVPSIDQMVVDAWKPTTKLPSLEVGVRNQPDTRLDVISWKAGYATLRPERNPANVFMRLFSSAPSRTGVSFEAIAASHRSVLDASLDSGRRLAARLGAADRRRLESHLEAVRDVEKRLQAGAAPAAACARPAPPPSGTGGSTLGIEVANNAHADLVALALACDLTRVFSFLFSAAQDLTVYRELGESEGYHTLTHNASWYFAKGKYTVVFKMKQLAYLAEKLKATPEGAGNLLDHTLVYGTTEMQDAAAHGRNDHPFILLGRAGGAVAGGTYVRTPTSMYVGSVMISALNAVGVPAKAMGDPVQNPDCYATQPAAGIVRGG
jgi:hypothetical protein